VSRAPETARAAARAARDAIGGEPRVFRYWDEPEENEVGILVADDRPGPGFTSYSTVTLHQCENRMDDNDIRVELAAIVDSPAEAMGNVLGTAAFNVMKDAWLAAPGVVFPDLLSEYDLSEELRNVVWMPPTPWDSLHSVELGEGITAHWLLAIPISESEREFLHREGYDAFDSLLAERDIEYWNLSREPLV
jgi:antitoxin YqcF